MCPGNVGPRQRTHENSSFRARECLGCLRTQVYFIPPDPNNDNKSQANKCHSVKTIFSFMDGLGEDSTCTHLLFQRTFITELQLGKIGHFINEKYPAIDLAYEPKGPTQWSLVSLPKSMLRSTVDSTRKMRKQRWTELCTGPATSKIKL